MTKRNEQTNLIPISGRVPVLNLEFAHGRSGFQPTVWKIIQKAAMELVFFFCSGIFWSQNAKEKSAEKSAGKIHPIRKQKSAGARPLGNPPARPKNPPQNLPTNPLLKPPSTRRVFSIEKACSWSRLQSIDSRTLFWLGKEKHEHKQISWIVPGLGGCPNRLMCFLGLFLMGEKTHKQNPPKSPGDNPVNMLFLCFFFVGFFRS